MKAERLLEARRLVLSPRLPAPIVKVAGQGQVVVCPSDLTVDEAEAGDAPRSALISFANRGLAARYLVGLQVSAPWLDVDMNSEGIQDLASGFTAEHGPIAIELRMARVHAVSGAADARILFSFSDRPAKRVQKLEASRGGAALSGTLDVPVDVHVASAGAASGTSDLGPLELSQDTLGLGNVPFFQEEEFVLPAISGERTAVRVWVNVLGEQVRGTRARRRNGCDRALIPVPDGVAYYQVCRDGSTLPDPTTPSPLALTPIGAASIRHLSRFSRQVTIRNASRRACTLRVLPLTAWLEAVPSELSLAPDQDASVCVRVLIDRARKGLREGLVRLEWIDAQGHSGSYDMPVSVYGAARGPSLRVDCEDLDFGKVLEGQQKVAEVPIANCGLGCLHVAMRSDRRLIDTAKVAVDNFDSRADAKALVPLTFHAERHEQGGRVDFDVLLNSNTYFRREFHRLPATAFVVTIAHTPEALDFGVITAGDLERKSGTLARNDEQPVKLVFAVSEGIEQYVSAEAPSNGTYDCLFDARGCRNDFDVQGAMHVQDAETGLGRHVPIRATVAVARIACKLGLRDTGGGLRCVGAQVAAARLDRLALAVRSCGRGCLRVSGVDYMPLAKRKRCHHLLRETVLVPAGDERIVPVRLPVGLWSRWMRGELIKGSLFVESNDPVYSVLRIPINLVLTPRLGRRGKACGAADPPESGDWFPRRG